MPKRLVIIPARWIAKQSHNNPTMTSLVLIVILVVPALTIIEQQVHQNTSTLSEVQASQGNSQQTILSIQRQIRACVTPGTECYKQRQKQTKDQITAIVAGVTGGTNEVSIYSAWCANKPGFQTVAEIQACVTNHVHPN